MRLVAGRSCWPILDPRVIINRGGWHAPDHGDCHETIPPERPAGPRALPGTIQERPPMIPRRRVPPRLAILVVVNIVGGYANAQPIAQPATLDYNRDGRPNLADRCFRCHGPDSGHRKAGLRLDRRDD